MEALDHALSETMNQESLSFALSQIHKIVSSLSKKNLSQSAKQLAEVSAKRSMLHFFFVVCCRRRHFTLNWDK